MHSTPWNVLPPCPHLKLEKAHTSGLIDLPNGTKVWHAVFGVALEKSLKTGIPPVFFLHGGLSHSGYYAKQIEYFAPSRTVVVFDHRGFGRSPLGDKDFVYADLASDLLGVLDYLNIPKAALVGWSEGAMLCWGLLASHPERIERMWAYGAIDDYRKTDGEKVSQIPMVQEYFGRMEAEWKEMNPKNDYGELMGKYVGMWMKDPVWDAETFKNVPIRGEAKDAPIVWVVTGDYDDWIPFETHQRFHSYVKNSSFLVMPGTGHMAFVQTPDLYNKLVEAFLADK